jgi:hypothetical protein
MPFEVSGFNPYGLIGSIARSVFGGMGGYNPPISPYGDIGGPRDIYSASSPPLEIQQIMSDYILNNPDLAAAYTGGGGVDLGGGLILTNRGLFDTARGEVVGTPPLVPVTVQPTGGGGSTSSASTSASESSTPSVDTTIVGGDSDLIRGPTITAGDLGGAATGPRQVQTTGNEYVYPNEKIISSDAELVRVHNNPDGSSVLVYSDGAEVFNPNGKKPDFTKWPTTPTPGTVAETQQPTDWNKVIDEWLIFNPNATKEQARQVGEAANVPADILNARIEARFPSTTVATGGTATTGGTAGTAGTTVTTGTGGTGGTVNTGGTSGTTGTATTAGTAGTGTTGTTATAGTGVGTGGGTGGGTGRGTGTGTGAGTGMGNLNPTRTTDGLFGADLFKFQQEYSLVGNLLSYGNRGMFR